MVICSCRKEHSKNVHKYFSGVGFTGIKNFLKANHWLAGLFWAIIITTGAVIAIYMTVLIVLNFVSSPTVTKIDILVTQDVIYPTITVCDSAGSYFLDDLKLRSANISRLQIGSLLLLAPLFILPKPDEPYQHWANVSDELIIEMQSKWKESGKKSESEAIWDFFHSFSVECDQIFVDCKNADFISFNCCEVFRPVLRPGYGICFSSDKTKMPTAQSPQLFSSLFLMFGTPSLFSPTGSSTTVRNPLEITLDDGVDQSVWRPDFIQLDFGFTTTVTLDILRIEEENSPENACLEDAELETFQVIR